MKIFVSVISLLAAVFGAEAFQCYHISESDCTAYDSTFRSACNDVEDENTRYVETCPPPADVCFNSAFYVSEPGLYRLNVTLGGCEYGVNNGCYTRSQLATINPTIEDAVDDLEDVLGSNIQGFQACFCTSNLCNTGMSNQGGGIAYQGGVTPKQGGVSPPRYNNSLLVQTSYMVVGLLAFMALLPVVDFTVM